MGKQAGEDEMAGWHLSSREATSSCCEGAWPHTQVGHTELAGTLYHRYQAQQRTRGLCSHASARATRRARSFVPTQGADGCAGRTRTTRPLCVSCEIAKQSTRLLFSLRGKKYLSVTATGHPKIPSPDRRTLNLQRPVHQR